MSDFPEIKAWMAANLKGAETATRLRKAIQALLPKKEGNR